MELGEEMNLYQEILKATERMHGWCSHGKQLTLANLVLAINPKVIVEIGVWGGQSLVPMAMAVTEVCNMVPEYVFPKIYAVDPWAVVESVKGQEGADLKWWQDEMGQPQHEHVYNCFIAKLMELGLRERVTIKRMTSDEFVSPPSIDLLHVDGNHGPQAIKDVQKFAPAIPSGGVCVLDDLNWQGGNVGKAAEWLKVNGFIELHPLGTGAVYLRP